jgi:PhzF family phenazine biosynthesis protein
MKIFQVDAFTDRVFSGNAAAVFPLDSWLDAEMMQNIAIENNLSETAFFVEIEPGYFHIRWFTPETEVNLCGHATLATAHVLYSHLGFKKNKVRFKSNSGDLFVEKKKQKYWLDFPSQPPKPISIPKLLPEAIGTIPIYTGVNIDLLVLLDSEQAVRSLRPDLLILKKMEVRGVIVTAPGESHDFVSRFFAPAVGVPEDPVTGSAHTVLTPFWAKRLGKKELLAFQVSKRGGELLCRDEGDRVKIGGSATTFLTGKIKV